MSGSFLARYVESQGPSSLERDRWHLDMPQGSGIGTAALWAELLLKVKYSHSPCGGDGSELLRIAGVISNPER
jgi:hypothetical protein